MADRRAKEPPLRDVAGMVRSFDYAAWSILMQADSVRPGAAEQLEALAMDWRNRAREAFLTAYRQAAAGCSAIPEDQETFHRLVTVFLIEKACYEIAYEAAQRPSWLVVPMRGLLSLLAPEEMKTDGPTG